MSESRSGKPKRHRIKIEPEGLSLLQIRMREAHAAALRATERELQGLDPYGQDDAAESELHSADIAPVSPKKRERKGKTQPVPERRQRNLGGFVSRKFNREFATTAAAVVKKIFSEESSHYTRAVERLERLFSEHIDVALFSRTLADTFYKAVKLAIAEKTLAVGDDDGIVNIFRNSETRFIEHLTAGAKRTETFKQALAVAANAHWYSAGEVTRLYSQYAELGINTIRRAIVGYPSDPAGFLNIYSATLAKVSATKEGAQVPISVLKATVLRNYDNPRTSGSRLRRYLRKTETVKRRFPGLPRHVQNKAALRKGTEPYVIRFERRVHRLMKRYPDVPKSTVIQATRDYGSMAKAAEYLSWYTDAEAYLMRISAKRGIVMEILRSHAFASKQELEKFL